ncbi:MAG: Hsp20/alpha crystallin family protein [Candidatus Marinimicrobia bacterium]|nr:Hsp20/alpha crystallin family protein [Candidatus Neomarinimicrobiota bacterium]
MTLVKWTPKRNIYNVFDDVEKMVSQAFGHSNLGTEAGAHLQPLLDVYETDNAIEVSLDLPGVDKKDVKVNVSNGLLTISGERKDAVRENSDGRIWQETSFGTFKRTFELTDAVVENKIKAQFKNGVLKISLPKAEKVKPSVRNISVS